MKRYNVECVECGAKNSFADVQDISQAKWIVLAWIVPDGDPRCVCNKCKYGTENKKGK